MFAVSGAQLGWLLGAGASASGGIPTAGQLLDEFKALLYASENNLDRSDVRMGDPLIGERVRRFFDNAHGLPRIGSPDEYAAAFELAFPDPAVRRQWLERWIAEGRPTFGHRVVAVLMASGLIRWVYGEWSRNLVLGLHDGGVQHGQELPMHLRNVSPGAVVRAMWAWMFALDPNLRLSEPDLAASVLSGDPVQPPSDKKLLIGATTSLGIWVSGQVGGYVFRNPVAGRIPSYKTVSGLRVVGPEEVDAPEVAISSPPFVALLAEADDDTLVRYTDTADWLGEDARARRDVDLLLPVVRGLRSLEELTLVT